MRHSWRPLPRALHLVVPARLQADSPQRLVRSRSKVRGHCAVKVLTLQALAQLSGDRRTPRAMPPSLDWAAGDAFPDLQPPSGTAPVILLNVAIRASHRRGLSAFRMATRLGASHRLIQAFALVEFGEFQDLATWAREVRLSNQEPMAQ